MNARKEYLESLAYCNYLDRFLPFVYQHNKLRFSREIRENPLAQTIDVSLRLTPPSYQRLELYRLLKEMRRQQRRALREREQGESCVVSCVYGREDGEERRESDSIADGGFVAFDRV